MSKFILFFYIIVSTQEVLCATGYAAWSFDNHDEMEILPEYQTASNFRADISPLGSDVGTILPQGRVGKCVFVNAKSFNLATDLGPTCFTDITQCSSGLEVSFYLKVQKWNDGTDQTILRTTNAERSTPGLYVGVEGIGILIYLQGSSGRTTWMKFSRSTVYQKWSRIEIFYNGKLSVNVNATSVKDLSWYSANTRYSTALKANPTASTNLTVGANGGLTFYLDEINLSYSVGHSSTLVSTPGSSSTPRTLRPTGAATEKTITTGGTSTDGTTTKAVTVTSVITTAGIATMIDETQSTSVSANTGAETKTESEFTTHVIGPKPAGDISNIWIPILIALLAFLAATGCILWLLCFRKRKRKANKALNREGIPLAEKKGEYFRASTIVPYHDEQESNQDTDDNQTDNEGNTNRLLLDRSAA